MENMNLIIREEASDDNSSCVNACTIRRAGLYKNSPNHYMSRIGQGVIEEGILIYCLSGEGFLTVNGIKSQVNKGDLVYCPPFEPHSYGASVSNPWQIQWVHFTGLINQVIVDGLCDGRHSQVIKGTYFEDQIPTLEGIISKLHRSTDLLTRIEVQGMLQVMIVQMIHSKKRSGRNNQNRLIQLTRQYMLEHVDETITVDQLAKKCHLSKYYYVRRFKSLSGMTPISYLRRLRMEKAFNLLVYTNDSIGSISEQVGYKNQFYFSECFKQYSSYTPSQYRQMMLKQY